MQPEKILCSYMRKIFLIFLRILRLNMHKYAKLDEKYARIYINVHNIQFKLCILVHILHM